MPRPVAGAAGLDLDAVGILREVGLPTVAMEPSSNRAPVIDPCAAVVPRDHSSQYADMRADMRDCPVADRTRHPKANLDGPPDGWTWRQRCGARLQSCRGVLGLPSRNGCENQVKPLGRPTRLIEETETQVAQPLICAPVLVRIQRLGALGAVTARAAGPHDQHPGPLHAADADVDGAHAPIAGNPARLTARSSCQTLSVLAARLIVQK
jgi:hypothetical protein